MQGRLTILCENTVTRPGGLVGEHGFAALLETDQGRYLFDTGKGLGLLANARLLDKDLTRLDGVILSHGHADHSGGLLMLLQHSGPLPVYGHPGLFTPRYWVGKHERRPNGCPFSRDQLAAAGGRMEAVTEFRELLPGLFLSGEIPRKTAFEKGDPNLMLAGEGGELVADPFLDDLSLALATAKGLLILVGCAHAGLVNIVKHFQDRTGERRLFAVLGGTHLAPADPEQLKATAAFLARCQVERLGLSHCTGLVHSAELAQLFPGRVSFANVGFDLDF